jgi:Family of unknown function (DUF5947)
MSAGNGGPDPDDRPVARRAVADAMGARRRAGMIAGLRGLARAAPDGGERAVSAIPGSIGGSPAAGGEVCDLCGIGISDDHRHLLALSERRIVCACEACWAMRSGEGDYRPTGNRTLWLPDLNLPDDLWAGFQIPIGLAFFMESTVTACVVAMYPSPAGATESELHFDSWNRLRELNPVLDGLEPDIEGLIVNRLADPPTFAIAPIDRCYALTGTIKAHWEGLSGGPELEAAVAQFFAGLRAEAIPA